MSRLGNLFLDHVGQTIDTPLGIEISGAEGIYMYSPDGKKYIDLISGVTVSNVGHKNRAVVDAVCAQAQNYMHLMVYGEIIQSPQVMYATKLAELLPDGLTSVYFVNSGSEAIEGALKLAKRYTGRTEMISFVNAYHGSTHGALSMMGDESFRNSFRPLLPDTRRLRFNCEEDLKYITVRTAAVLIEPVQGEAGVISPKNDFLKTLRKRCDEVGALLIFDEIQSGFGRVGKIFAATKFGVTPDILCMAKAMGGGMPLGGFAARPEVMSAFKTNPILGHITTFGGHAVCCAAGLAALNYIDDHKLLEEVEHKGATIEKLITADKVKEIRREGLLMAIEFGSEDLCNSVARAALSEGLISESFLFCPSALRVAPPLTITMEEIEMVCEKLNKVINSI